MITTPAYYLVAYPHSTIHPTKRIKRFKLDPDAVGKDLLGLLKDAYPEHSGDLDDVTLWKTSDLASTDVNRESDDEIYAIYRENGLGVVIPLEHTMALVFPEGPHEAKEGQIDIVAMTPEIVDAMVLQADLVNGDLRHMEARAELAKTMRTFGSPSEVIKSYASIKAFLEAPNAPRCGRPITRTGPPTALLSPELALLQYDLEHLDDLHPGKADVVFSCSLNKHATSPTHDAGGREAILRLILGRFLERSSEGQVLTTGRTWLEGSFTYPIIEIMRKRGDPHLQGLVVYSKIIAQEECQQFLSRSNLPVVLLAIDRTRFTISTAIYTDSVYAVRLFSHDFDLGPYNDNILRAARAFMAIRECTERLRRLYRNLGATTRLVPAAKILYPNPTPDPRSTEGIPELEFFSKVDRSTGAPINQTVLNEENKRHAMYLARMRNEDGTSTKTVFVKFVEEYNAIAHRLLASNKPPLAPALYSCTRVAGDILMVVMEYLPVTSLRDVPLPLSAATYEAVRRDVSRALELLHEQDLVFGDLQEANLLYLPEDGGRALLVDFDNVGCDGKDTYPAFADPDRREDRRFEIMEQSHDTEDFGKLMDWLSGLR